MKQETLKHPDTCPKCGRKIPMDARKCPHCGETLVPHWFTRRPK